MSATVKCALCNQRFTAGTAAHRVAEFNRHQCNQLPPIDDTPSVPAGIMVMAALLTGFMVAAWIIEWLANAEWFTPVALFAIICIAGVAVFKLTERNAQ